MLTPKQVLFFEPVIKALKERGDEIVVTSRHYREAELMIRKRQIKAEFVGAHGGKNLVSKLSASLDRTEKLTEIYGENNNWQGYLWTYKEIFGDDCYGKNFRIDFKSEDNREHWYHGFINDIQQYYNPPIAFPIDGSDYSSK